MAAPHAPDPDVVAEAFRLTLPPPEGEDLSLAQVGIRLGVSKATAGNYVQKAIAHRPFVELHKRAVQQGGSAKRLITMLYELYEYAAQVRPTGTDDDPARWFAALDYAAKREAQLATLLGLNSPAKLDITTDGGRNGSDAPKDGALIAALARMEARDALDDREIRAGRPGVIEGGNTA